MILANIAADDNLLQPRDVYGAFLEGPLRTWFGLLCHASQKIDVAAMGAQGVERAAIKPLVLLRTQGFDRRVKDMSRAHWRK